MSEPVVKKMRSLTLSPEEIDNLTKEVAERNLRKSEVTNPYESLRVKDRDIFLVLYKTGKLVFQESEGMDDVLNKVLTRKLYHVIGTDEAGKGEWYGPLVVAGVALTPGETIDLRKMGVGDSKLLSSFRIYEIGGFLQKSEIEKEVRILSPEKYNLMYESFKKENKNLNDILLSVHTEIIHDLLTRIYPEKAKVVIDQFDVNATFEKVDLLRKFNADITQKTEGESEVAVACASVLAKFTFEEEVKKLNETCGLDLKTSHPDTIPREILPLVAKVHFKNVKRFTKG